MKESKFEPWELEDSDRLAALWEDYKAATGATQTQFAADNGLGSQGNLGHYIKKRQPLNLDAVVKLANGLGCPIDAISPTLARRILDAATKVTNTTLESHWPIKSISASEYEQLSDSDRTEIETLLAIKVQKLHAKNKSVA